MKVAGLAPGNTFTPATLLASAVSSPRVRLVAARLLTCIPVLFAVTLLTFVLLDLLPGNAARQLLGATATPDQIARLEAELNIDRPMWERYIEWLRNAARGDLGKSLVSQQPVTALIAGRTSVTMQLLLWSLVVSLAIAIPSALAAARKPGGLADRLILLVSIAGLSAAGYVLALILVLAFAVSLPWFPSIGFVPPGEGFLAHLRSITLPALSIALPLGCLYARFLRGDLVEQMAGQEYIATAIAKGIGPWRTLVNHALRNSLLGLITVVGVNLGALLGGTIVIEQIFALPGLGQLLLQAINTRDAALVQALVLLIASGTVLANLFVDLLCAALDPRIRYARD